MWKRVDSSQSSREMMSKKSTLQILPCTVSQLLSASHVGSGNFVIGDCELFQVSVVGVVRGFAPFVTFMEFSVDDMTAPPVKVKQWVNSEDCAMVSVASPGSYVKVTGSLRNFNGQRSLLAMNIRCIKDLNEITSHMLEVIQAHMKLPVKEFDVNMNSLVSQSGRFVQSMSTIQDQVIHVIRTFPDQTVGISFDDLRTEVNHIAVADIRSSLAFLLNEGHVFTTIDEYHYKTTL
ncbi:replication protein A 32 kDa subunit-like [Solea solea]|uniref:replication protein A 32 kDa subunit-like n=1 Tax=Solea solea TaxID=90069 RepID=UPI00272D9375|nr:replication protein A 32 kDa subunit-like [Solea solea]